MQSFQFIRQRVIVKLAIIVFFIKVVFFHLTGVIDDGTSSIAPYEYQTYNNELLYKEDWSPELGEQLGLTQKEYRVKRRQYYWWRKQESGSTPDQFRSEQKLEDDALSFMNSDFGSNRNDVNIPAAMGYFNLSCPFEWYKYSCAAIQENEIDEQVTAAAMQYYQQHLAEIYRAFDSAYHHPQQQQPKRIFMTGDSLLRQLFISLACNAFSLNIVQQSEIQWRQEWPCPKKLATTCVFTGGQHSGFDAASIRLTNGMEIHFVPHRGFAYGDMSKGEPDVLERMKWQIDNLGNRIGFGKKTALPPSGPMTHFVYNVGTHYSIWTSRKILTHFVKEIATPLMKNERRPKIIYVVTPTAHFNTGDGQYIRRGDVMDDEKSKCVERISHNPRAKMEKRIVKEGVSVDVLIEYDDLDLGALHVQKGDCVHYCMPGAADLVAARLLESF